MDSKLWPVFLVVLLVVNMVLLVKNVSQGDVTMSTVSGLGAVASLVAIVLDLRVRYANRDRNRWQ